MESGTKNYHGNIYDKYHSKNIFVKYAVEHFLNNIKNAVNMMRIETVLDCGCGEGYLSNFIYCLKKPIHVSAIDIDNYIIKKARQGCHYIDFINATLYNIPYKNNAFDLVVVTETMEHLAHCDRALNEIIRVGRRYFIFSVPHEPYWHFINILGGKYIKKLGNTPGHINFWTKKSFLNYIENKLQISKDISAFPWTMILCNKKFA